MSPIRVQFFPRISGGIPYISRYGCNMTQDTADHDNMQMHGTSAQLRILETTDLHMQLLDYDYYADRPDNHSGLIRLIDQIDQQRSGPHQNSLLFDNGDFLQGNPLADYLATRAKPNDVHPMIAAFNALEYDAITLGNHEFNYGLPFLRRTLQDAQFPVTCANITHETGSALAQKFVILDRRLHCGDGQLRDIKIGVIGFVTPQITQWDHTALAGQLTSEDIVICAQRLVPQIKAAGADLIVALCHAGIGPSEHTPRMENAAVPLAAINGIDVILTGHTHDIFPDAQRSKNRIVDPIAGTLHGKPAVMAGFYGNRLGVIDLDLGWTGGKWTIRNHKVTLQNGGDVTEKTQPLYDKITAIVKPAHDATLRHIRKPIAVTTAPIHSYFAAITPDLSQHLLAQAKRDYTVQALLGRGYDDLPIVATAAPFRFGDRAGPGHYIDVAPGNLTMRDAAAIYPFANTFYAIHRRGAELRAWLERSAAHFAQLTPGSHAQSLINPQSAGYNFDTLFGVHYDIDLSQPARYDTTGIMANPKASRIKNLTCNGTPVRDDDRFILATNSYRTYGGGNFPAVPSRDILYGSKQSTREILISHLRKQASITQSAQTTWGFTPLPDTSATFLSSPAARQHMTPAMRHLGPGPAGFDQFQLML